MMKSSNNVKIKIGKKHALKKYDHFALNTGYFWGSTGPVVQFHEIFVTKIMNKLIYCYCYVAKISGNCTTLK